MNSKKHKTIFKVLAIISGLALLAGAFLPFIAYL
jgi:hypothetical protein